MRVLIAEDDLVSRGVLEALLTQWGHEVVVARDGAQAWEIIQNAGAPLLAILDSMIPGMSGPDICRRVRERPASLYTYLIMLTGRGRPQDMIGGPDGGADDYLIKPFEPHELQGRVRAGERLLDLRARLLATQEELRRQATHDALTGLFNRGAILAALEQELYRGDRELKPVAAVVADLDHFKQINDTYGHQAGDEVLREAARRLRALMRAYDALGRYGGEEFLLVLPGCDAPSALGFARRALDCLEAEAVETTVGRLRVTISLGVATSGQVQEVTAAALIRAADRALYRAKRAGRNRAEAATAEDFTL